MRWSAPDILMNNIKRKKGFNRLGLFFIIFSALFLSSCAYNSDIAYLNDQILSLNKRLTKLENSIGTKLGSDLEAIHSGQAEMRVGIDRLRGKVGDLSGRVEDNERIIKRSVERDLGEQDAVQSGLVNLSQKVTWLETTVKRNSEYLGFEPAQEAQGSERGDIEGEGTGPGQAVDPKSKGLELYDISLASLKGEKYEEAMNGFQNFLKKYPKSDRADNAQFWVGECHMALKEYEQAILAYQNVIKKYPKGNKVPNAMLRQAAAFLEIKDKTSSRLLLKKLIKKYPKSNEAKIAQKRLRTLR